jgi:hypothetical protein
VIDPNEKNDFQDFVNSIGVSPSEKLNKKILHFVKTDLDPSHKVVFAKLLGIQTFIGFLTLTFCPQFKMSLTNEYDLFHYFHHNFGESICMIICGSIFIGSGALFAAYLLNSNEVKKIRESRILYYTSISIISLSAFFLLGSDIYLKLTIFWLIGSTVGGIVMFELNRFIRKAVFNY